ncbi:MAG TPA: hypothetical protein PLK90_05865 [Clostridiales bacterium]|nr:hypothetical protein [Clostridiales bacterium]
MHAEMPVVFRITLNSFYGRSYSLILREHKLLYSSTRPVTQIIRDPSEEDWRKFWKKTVNRKIWLWSTQYVDKTSSDGSTWSVNIEAGRLTLKSYGSNNYPENFQQFIADVRDLIPGLEFSIC